MKKLILVTLASFLFVACPAKKDTAGRTATTTGGRGTSGIIGGGTNPGGTTPIVNNCAQNVSPIGTIYDQGQQQATLYASGSFEDRVKAFLSATVNPTEVGQISSAPADSTGVRFQGTVKLDQNGMVISAQSKIIIKVYDSYMLQNSSYQAIPVQIDPANGGASEGQFNMQTGAGYIVFKDQYGEVRLDGKIDAQFFSGTMSFRNYSTVTGGTPAQGQLGQFYVARCGIIQ